MTKHYNDLKAFPELNLEELQNRAKDWVDYFYAVIFEKILLYHHDKRPLLYSHDKRRYELIPKESRIFHYWRSIEYVLVFVVSNFQDINLSNIELYPVTSVKREFKLDVERFYELWEWIPSLKQILNPDQFVNSPTDIDRHHLFNSDFCNKVYNSPTDENFYKKWRTILKRPHEELDRDFVRDDKPHWVLYPAEPVLVVEHEAQPNRYEFYQEGPSWTIIYEGEVLRGLKGKGFEELHFLVKNERKIFHINEIIQETEKVPPDSLSKTAEFNAKQGKNDKTSKDSTNHRDLADDKFKKELKEKRISLQKAVQEAENNNDIPRLEKAKMELERFYKFRAEYFGKNGKARKVVDETTNSKNRVNRRIERALKEIKKYDENTFNHFHTAIKKTNNNYFLQYNPVRHIDWITEKK